MIIFRRLPLSERLQIFLQRLLESKHTTTYEEAYLLIHYLINKTEDDFTDISYRPHFSTIEFEGRMYGPLSDNEKKVENRDDIIRFRARKHYVIISLTGAILITSLTDEIIVSKPDIHGKEIIL